LQNGRNALSLNRCGLCVAKGFYAGFDSMM
jgi:hypothetical protein